MLPEDDDNGGWSRRDTLRPENMLYIYRPEGEWEQRIASSPSAPEHAGRLFLHDVCHGQRYTYTIEHVNTLLESADNPDNIKERIVELLPQLAEHQKQWVADGISDAALWTVRDINYETAQMITNLQARQVAHAR